MIYDETFEDADGVKYELVASIDEDLGWEWHTGAILRDAEGKLFWYSDSGCSCNYYGDYPPVREDMTEIKNWQEAVELAKEEFPESDVFDFANSLRNG